MTRTTVVHALLTFVIVNLGNIENIMAFFHQAPSLNRHHILTTSKQYSPVPKDLGSNRVFTSTNLFSGSGSMISDASPNSALMNYFLETVITCAVPTFFTIVTIGFIAFLFFKMTKRDMSYDEFGSGDSVIGELYNDLYSSASPKSKFNFFNPSNKKQSVLSKNVGIPSIEYIMVENLNTKYQSYDYSIAKATSSKAAAAATYRSQAFDRALQVALVDNNNDPIPSYTKTRLLQIEESFLREGAQLVKTIQSFETKLIQESLDTAFEKIGLEKGKLLDPEPSIESTSGANETVSLLSASNSGKSKINQEISKLKKQLSQLELDFIQEVVICLGPKRAPGIRAALLGDVVARGSGGLLTQVQDRPLSVLLSGSERDLKSLFVMKFPGDVTASQLNELREEVTAIVRNAKPGDEALVILQSGGGTVTGYGLAAGQLVRLKEKGIFLTIAVEQVAASGGYMMTCVADKIVASPFAVLGSIGVISEIPNAYERLKKEGIEFQTVTAGEFKRTLTPTKKVTKEDFKKAKDDVEMILTQFRDFVQSNRPQLNVADVATGETWFGEAALAKGLCDEIKTVDDILLHYVNDLKYNVYQLTYKPPPDLPQGLSGLLPTSSLEDNSMGQRLIQWLVSSIAKQVSLYMKQEIDTSLEKRYMARDNTADEVKIKD